MSETDQAAVTEAVAFGVPQQLNPDLFRALSHPTRCVLLELLAKGLTRPTQLAREMTNVFGLWHHLNKLRDMGVVKARHVTRKRTVYSVNVELVREMAQQLTDIANQADATRIRVEGEADETLQHELEEVLEA